MPLIQRVRSPPDSPRIPSMACVSAATEPLLVAEPLALQADAQYRKALSRRREELRHARKPIRWIALAAFGVAISMVVGSLLVASPDGTGRLRLRKRDTSCVNGSDTQQQENAVITTESTTLVTSQQLVSDLSCVDFKPDF
jgi:hypothetical protein